MRIGSAVELSDVLRADGLEIVGGFHPASDDSAPEGTRTLVLLGPREPGFWARVSAEPEFCDGRPDPLDRWSRRVIERIAGELGAHALFPFTGPPWHPFFTWALRTRRAWRSPVQLLVHDGAGLFVSFRGALALPEAIELPAPPEQPPCAACASEPCRAACPVGALTPSGYDTAACHAFLDTAAGRDCLDGGCRVRRSCPVSASYGRLPIQSAHHMRHFHPREVDG